MNLATPRFTLGLLWLAAVAIMAGGIVFSKREVQVRLKQDRAPLQQFVGDLQRELRRLENLHEHDLLLFARAANPDDTMGTRQNLEAIAGVVECSLLPRDPSREGQYVRAGTVKLGEYPRPAFEGAPVGRTGFVFFDPKPFFDSSASSSGWIEESGKPLFYWRHQRSASSMIMLTVEPREVQKVMSGWIEQWMPAHLATLQAGESSTQGSEELTMPDGRHLSLIQGSEVPPEPPHWSQPLPTRYGTWNVVSWDRIETRVSHDAPTLAVAAALAILVAWLGVFVFAQQKRALRLAAQRVSFVNRVSHELRTPLTNMLLNLDIVAESAPHSRLGLVREEAGRLSRLIENVLTFSRHEQGHLRTHVSQCRPRAIVDGIAEQFASSFERRGIAVHRVHEGDDTACWMDGDALAQITANLLSNVEKYAPHASARIVTVQHGNVFTMTVSDDGPGIPEKERECIFEPFTRLHDRVNEGVTGTGLGLAIARDLAQRMGGNLRLLQAAKGAAFEFYLGAKGAA